MRAWIVAGLSSCCLLLPAHSASACGWEPFCNGFTAEEAVQWAEDQAGSAPRADESTARKYAFAAYGEGTTSCTVTVLKSLRPGTYSTWDFEGTTDCSTAVSQSGQAFLTGAGTASAPLCSGFQASCRSAGAATGDYTGVGYRVTLVAPPGQGWIAPPAECAGAGTDQLECTF